MAEFIHKEPAKVILPLISERIKGLYIHAACAGSQCSSLESRLCRESSKSFKDLVYIALYEVNSQLTVYIALHEVNSLCSPTRGCQSI